MLVVKKAFSELSISQQKEILADGNQLFLLFCSLHIYIMQELGIFGQLLMFEIN